MFFVQNHLFDCRAAVSHSRERNPKERVCDYSKRAHETAGQTHDWLVTVRVKESLQACWVLGNRADWGLLRSPPASPMPRRGWWYPEHSQQTAADSPNLCSDVWWNVGTVIIRKCFLISSWNVSLAWRDDSRKNLKEKTNSFQKYKSTIKSLKTFTNGRACFSFSSSQWVRRTVYS